MFLKSSKTFSYWSYLSTGQVLRFRIYTYTFKTSKSLKRISINSSKQKFYTSSLLRFKDGWHKSKTLRKQFNYLSAEYKIYARKYYNYTESTKYVYPIVRLNTKYRTSIFSSLFFKKKLGTLFRYLIAT
jgi:hypothetical protein